MNIIPWVKPYLKVSQIKSSSRKCRTLIRLHKAIESERERERDSDRVRKSTRERMKNNREREIGNPELALYQSNI